ncbi:MAG: hypothetical protein KKD94_06355, partial [Nanoarchaeota archaeon]|nr:hypothetical protein [Nanoarchaeota archaeon]
ADILFGGIDQINSRVAKKLNCSPAQIASKIEHSMFTSLQAGDWLDSLSFHKNKPDSSMSYLNDNNWFTSIKEEIHLALSSNCKIAKGIKIAFLDGRSAQIDSQSHCFWQVQNIPSDFSVTSSNAISYVKEAFLGDAHLVLQFAQESNDLPFDLFVFLSALQHQDRHIAEVTIFGVNLEDIERIRIPAGKTHRLIWGMFPQQLGNYIRMNMIGDFRQFFFAPLKQGYFIADVDFLLTQPYTNEQFTIKGSALKIAENGQIQLFILQSPVAGGELATEQLTETYLNHWPNLGEGITDLRRKLELFTYTGDNPFSLAFLAPPPQRDLTSEISALSSHYLSLLDAFVRRFFLPSEYEQVDFSTTKERFYGLNGKAGQCKDGRCITLHIPAEYPFLKHLDYACRRVNEKQVILPDGKKLWLTMES